MQPGRTRFSGNVAGTKTGRRITGVFDKLLAKEEFFHIARHI
jgi:hypothetical protein